MTTTGTTTSDDDLVTDWQAWHTAREAELAAPHGWLSLAELYWLDATPAAFPDLPGTWRVTGDGGVALAVVDGEDVRIDGAPVSGTVRLEPVDGLPGILVATGDRLVEVLRRNDEFGLRVRDPQAVTRTAFAGVPHFPVQRRWVRPGRFEPYAQPRPVTVAAVVEGLTIRFEAVGEIVFDVDGVAQRLVAFPAREGGLTLHFRDGTSGTSTYGGGRSLRVADPAADGAVTVDLNRAFNMPCAFTAFGTCPMPPAGNVVSVAVEAGERTPARPDLG